MTNKKRLLAIALSLALLASLLTLTCSAYTIATDANGDGLYNRHFQPYSVSYTTYTPQYEEYSTATLALTTDLITNRPKAYREQGYKFYNYIDNPNPRASVSPALGSYTTNRVVVNLTAPLVLEILLPNNLATITDVLAYAGGDSASGGLGFFTDLTETEFDGYATMRYAVTDLSHNTFEYTATSAEYPDLYNPFDLLVADYTDSTLQLATITILSYELDIQGHFFGTDWLYLDFEQVSDTTNHWRALTTPDLTDNINIGFDGDVGVADLLIKPMQSIINFELFPGFSLGGVFGVLAGISLFVIILKVFAGG